MTIMSNQEISCPWCGEYIDLIVDGSQSSGQYVEDCQVCCRPIVVAVTIDGCGGISVDTHRENE